VEDSFQAQVCLGWVHWHLGEPALAVGRLPKNVEEEFAQLDGTNKELAEWTKVCALKASYVKGSSLRKTGAVAEALESFQSGLPIFTIMSSNQKQWKELRSWMELFLTGFCIVTSLAIKSKITSPSEPEALTAFRAWSRFCDGQGFAAMGGCAPQAEVSRRQVWKEYYITLSDILQQELPLPPAYPTAANTQTPSRFQQRAELKQVEAKYETMLLSELQFPRAENSNQEVEAFIEIVIQNWSVLCGSKWTDRDLGEGGAEGVSRGVLDILYRAATKTFHSTSILRHLFSVHLAVADFDLAFKAFDTYMDIVKKGKARTEKTGEKETSLDDDEMVLRTASECIKALCRYGSRQGAEKARDIGQFFEDWLDKHHPAPLGNEKGHAVENVDSAGLGTIIAPKILALAWRCIGISHAQWARLTFDASSRPDSQLKAIKCFKKSLLPEYESTANVETLFALGTILAERRELPAAVEIVKFGLLPPDSSAAQSHVLGQQAFQFARERSLIPLWHLLALLLSARQEFVMAVRACEGAFEQFRDPKNLFGESNLNYRSDHLNEKSSSKHHGIFDDMDDFEKQNVLEVKMTQLTLIEVLEGPEVAVNSCGELFNLYTRLFGSPSKDTIAPVASSTPLDDPPKSSAGTIKSLKGSIFGRSARKSLPPPATGEKSGALQRSHTIQTVSSQTAPTIEVTNESGREAKHPHLMKGHRPEKHRESEGTSQRNPSGPTGSKTASKYPRNISVNTTPAAQEVVSEEVFMPPSDPQVQTQWLNDGQRASQVGIAISPDTTSINNSQEPSSQPLPPKSQQMAHKEKSLKPADLDPEKAQDNRLPNATFHLSSTNPITRFPQEQQRQRRVAILVKVWLLVSGFYRRAALYDDAKGAIEEAQKLVQSVDVEVFSDSTGSQTTSHQGWGGGKGVKELWADVSSEVSITSPYTSGHTVTCYTARCSRSR
jgi:cargo-transport protein YPP1